TILMEENMKILIIDDEPIVRRAISKAAQHKGHNVENAQDGEEGLAKWLDMDPDIVFLDIFMPKLTGPQLLKKIPTPRAAKVILMSAFSGIHDIKSMSQDGADLFIEKPFHDIFQVIETAENLIKVKSNG